MLTQLLSALLLTTTASAWRSCLLAGYNDLGLYPDEVSDANVLKTLTLTSVPFTLDVKYASQNGSASAVMHFDNSTSNTTPYASVISNDTSAASWVFLTFTPDARYSSLLGPSSYNGLRATGLNDMAFFLRDTLSGSNTIEPLRYADSTIGTTEDTEGTYGTLGLYIDGRNVQEEGYYQVGAPLRFLGYNRIATSFVACVNQVVDGESVAGPFIFYKWANTTAPAGCSDVQLTVREVINCDLHNDPTGDGGAEPGN